MSLPSCELGVGFSTAASKWCGGVEFARILGASTLTDVAHALRELVAGKVLIGHGLKNDLMSLGIQHPFESMRDTANYKKFQRGDGSTYSLKQLAKHWLQKDIQSRRKRHSAREDAQAVMELYKRCILTDPSQMLSEQEMIDAYLFGLQIKPAEE